MSVSRVLGYLKQADNFSKYTVSKIRFHKNIAIIKFDEINSINEVTALKAESAGPAL